MGTPTLCRKRVDEHFSLKRLSYLPKYSHQIDSQIQSKKLRLSPSLVPNLGMSTSSTMSTAAKVSRYPEAKAPFRREVHAPRPVRKFGFARVAANGNSSNGFRIRCSGCSQIDVPEPKMEFLLKKLKQARSTFVKSFRYLRKDNEVIDVEQKTQNEKEKNAVSVDSSVEEVGILGVVNEGGSVISDQTLQHRSPGKLLENGIVPASSEVVASDMTKVDQAEKQLDSLSLGGYEPCVPGRQPYSLLLESQNRRKPKLDDIDFQIKVHEARRTPLSLRPVKKPDAKEDALQEAFLPLTEQEMNEVLRALSDKHKNKILVSHEGSNIEITVGTLHCLNPREWLNDEVINLYLELLKEREAREPKKFLKCHFFNTFFYKKLVGGRNGYDYKSVRRWTTKRKLGYSLIECEKIFVPIHQTIHWCLAVINKKEEKFQYLDSMKGVDRRVLGVLSRYFVDEVKDKSGQDIDVSSWAVEYVNDLPQQTNGSDCGVFMIKYADFYSRGLGLEFSQEDMNYFRYRTAKEISRLRAD